MSAVDLPRNNNLVEYRVDRLLEEANTDTRIVVLGSTGRHNRCVSDLGRGAEGIH